MPYAEYQLPVDDELNPFDEDSGFGVAVGEMDPTVRSGVRLPPITFTNLTPQQQAIINDRNTGTAILQNPSPDNTLVYIGAGLLIAFLVLGKGK